MAKANNTSPAHSPAPWKSVAQIPETYSIQSGDEIICVTSLEGDIDEANANLIAAAPGLLEACEGLLRDCNMALSGEWDKSDSGFRDSAHVLENAIAQAKGE